MGRKIRRGRNPLQTPNRETSARRSVAGGTDARIQISRRPARERFSRATRIFAANTSRTAHRYGFGQDRPEAHRQRWRLLLRFLSWSREYGGAGSFRER